MAQTKQMKVLVCRRGFAAPRKDGRMRVVKGGEMVPADDPIVKGREHLFDPLEEVVEQATAAPGELRATKPRTKASKPGDGEDAG